MPIYEYRCAACEKVVEAIQRFSDPPLDKCPSCGGGPVSKLVSRASFQLKGSGWYATDYKKTSGTDSTSETKSESKPASSGASDSKKSGSEG